MVASGGGFPAPANPARAPLLNPPVDRDRLVALPLVSFFHGEGMSLLALDRVSKRFGSVTAVDGVSFTVGRGEVVGFLGPNGAGKSTTMRMITQYLDPDDGSIRFDGTPLAESREAAKRRIGYLPENNPLYGEMLVAEYLD